MNDTNHIEVLRMILDGRISGRISEWPQIKPAIEYVITALSARASAGEGEEIAWESTTVGFTHYITDARYQKFSPEIRRWYKPYRCANCAAAPQPAQAELRAWVGDMKTSAGMDYYVCVGRDTGNPFERTYLTPHKYSIRGRAEYDVAEWNHLLGHGPKPDILAFDTQPTPASPATRHDNS